MPTMMPMVNSSVSLSKRLTEVTGNLGGLVLESASMIRRTPLAVLILFHFPSYKIA